MTVIVYDPDTDTIACDSRTSTNGFINSDSSQKWLLINGNLCFFAGDLGDVHKLKNALIRGTPTTDNLDVEAFIVKNNGTVAMLYGGDLKEYPCVGHEAIGCGYRLAIAALDHGKNVKEAVEYAISRDNRCGGTVHVFCTNTLKEIEL